MEKKFLFCPCCDEERDESQTSIVERIEIFPIKEANVEVQARVRICNVCQNDIFDESLDFAAQGAAFEKYRTHHGLVSPDFIRNLRTKYELTQRELAQVLGFGAATIARYESGSLPEEAQSNLLLLMDEPHVLRKLLLHHRSRINAKTFSKLEEVFARCQPDLRCVATAVVEDSAFPKHLKTDTPQAKAGEKKTRHFDGRNFEDVEWMKIAA